MSDYHKPEVYLERCSRELTTIRQLVSKVVNAIHEAESEVPEKMRRFVMYLHDMHDVKNMFVEHGLEVPAYVMRELERCDDRLRQLLEQLHLDGGAFEKVRREMASDPRNRWDHSRELMAPKGESDESEASGPIGPGPDEDRAEVSGSESGQGLWDWAAQSENASRDEGPVQGSGVRSAPGRRI